MVTFYRRLPKLDYIKPESMEEAIDLLNSNRQYRVYAGGTDLIPRLKARILKAPDAIVDLKGITDLDYIKYDDTTSAAVKEIQSAHGLPADGFVGPLTKILLYRKQPDLKIPHLRLN